MRPLIQCLDAVAAVSLAPDPHAHAAAAQPSSSPSSLWSGLCRPSVRRRMRRRFASAASAASGRRRGDQNVAEESSGDEGEKEREAQQVLTRLLTCQRYQRQIKVDEIKIDLASISPLTNKHRSESFVESNADVV